MNDDMETEDVALSQHSELSSQVDQSNSRAQRRQPCEVRKVNSISDAGRFPLVIDRYFNEEGLLVPQADHLQSMDSQSKVHTKLQNINYRT